MSIPCPSKGNAFDKETNLRISLNADITTLKTQLRISGLKDALSIQLSNWANEFGKSLKCRDISLVKIRYIALLKEILVDPWQAPLDEDSVLGSDGIVYGKKSLTLHINMVNEIFRSRSPIDPNNPAPFHIDQHRHVKPMIEWLKKHSSYAPSEEVEKKYQALLETKGRRIFILDDIPCSDPRKERIRRMINMQRERTFKEDADINKMKEESAKASENIKKTFKPVNERTDNFHKKTFENLNHFEANMKKDNAQFNQAAESLEEEISGLEKGSQKLDSDINESQAKLSEAEKESLYLEKRIIDAKIEIRKRRKKLLKKIITAAAIVGGCGLATWALHSGMLAIGSSVKAAVLPIANGAKIAISIPF